MALTPLELIAGASLSNNSGIQLSTNFTNAISSYTSTTPVVTLLSVLGNTVSANLQSSTVLSLETLGATNCPALSDSTPSSYASALGIILANSAAAGNSITGFTGVLTGIGNIFIGSGDSSKFAQIFTATQSYIGQTNRFINSVTNANVYYGTTFTSMNSLISGSLTDVNLATAAFGADLAKLGQLIDLNNLDNLGSPVALLAQLFTVSGVVPVVKNALIQAGIDEQTIGTLNTPGYEAADTVNRQAYLAMQTVTGTDLSYVLALFGVTLTTLTTMADLLDPVKIFPNSYQTLTVTTASGLRAIYIPGTSSVNFDLLQYLPEYVVRTAA